MRRAKTQRSLTILIPGNRWGASGGWGKDNPLFRFSSDFLDQSPADHRMLLLKWSGGNNDRCRLEAADMLRRLIEQHQLGENDTLSILTHSHGGNVALAASHQSVAHKIDNLIALNKPTLVGKAYRAGPTLGNFFNISASRDWTQWAGSNAKLTGKWATDPDALNLKVDTSSSNLGPHGALIWDDKIREIWWNWLKGKFVALGMKGERDASRGKNELIRGEA